MAYVTHDGQMTQLRVAHSCQIDAKQSESYEEGRPLCLSQSCEQGISHSTTVSHGNAMSVVANDYEGEAAGLESSGQRHS